MIKLPFNDVREDSDSVFSLKSDDVSTMGLNAMYLRHPTW